jgi:hypothetical protein
VYAKGTATVEMSDPEEGRGTGGTEQKQKASPLSAYRGGQAEKSTTMFLRFAIRSRFTAHLFFVVAPVNQETYFPCPESFPEGIPCRRRLCPSQMVSTAQDKGTGWKGERRITRFYNVAAIVPTFHSLLRYDIICGPVLKNIQKICQRMFDVETRRFRLQEFPGFNRTERQGGVAQRSRLNPFPCGRCANEQVIPSLPWEKLSRIKFGVDSETGALLSAMSVQGEGGQKGEISRWPK